MPLFEENKINNADSKSKVGANKLIRDRSRAIKDERKSRIKEAKDAGAGTKVIRAIKSEYSRNKSGIYDVSTSGSDVKNLESPDSTIQDNSIDNAYDNPDGGDLPATIDILVCNSGTGVSETITIYYQP
tara:strand:- start:104 stop:490 length:387 start_codon:yes stop_codon:yes gene_type:complete